MLPDFRALIFLLVFCSCANATPPDVLADADASVDAPEHLGLGDFAGSGRWYLALDEQCHPVELVTRVTPPAGVLPAALRLTMDVRSSAHVLLQAPADLARWEPGDDADPLLCLGLGEQRVQVTASCPPEGGFTYAGIIDAEIIDATGVCP